MLFFPELREADIDEHVGADGDGAGERLVKPKDRDVENVACIQHGFEPFGFFEARIFFKVRLLRIDRAGPARVVNISGVEHVMLVALSGYGRDEDKARALAAGFHMHLTKPVDPDRLQALMAELRTAESGG